MNKIILACIVLLIAGAAIFSMLPGFAANSGSVSVFSGGKAKVFLNVTDMVGLDQPIADLNRCFSQMTGVDLPAAFVPQLFDPTQNNPLRVECRVVKMDDLAKHNSDNGSVSLLLSPLTHFSGMPFSVTGQKVAFSCTWHAGRKQFDMNLTMAKDAYYGPGYGPFTFEKMVVNGADPQNNSNMRLAIEMRSAEGADVRAGYTLDGENWTYTKWYNPADAGTDTSVPGESDKNGPQAWQKDWAKDWKDKTAAYVTAYGPVDRKTQIIVDEMTVSQAGKVLSQNKFSHMQAKNQFYTTPSQGTVTLGAGGAIMQPEEKGYYTVGIRLNKTADTAGLIPIDIEFKPMPKGASYADSELQQGYEIAVSKNRILLQAHSRLGIQNAIYALLDGWGCRWIIPGDLGEVIPRHTSLSLNVGTIKNPKGYDNGPDGSTGWSGEQDIKTWYNRNMGGKNHSQSSNHYWHYAIPPSKHFKDHPEWYALIGGKRVPSQLCTSNPEVIAEMIKAAKAYLKANPTAVTFPMDPEDNADFCQCDNCTAIDPPYVGKDGNPLLTDRVIAFCNAVADGIKDEFPDRRIGVLAYSNHLLPPVNVKPHENVIITICRSNTCWLHYMPVDGCDSSKEFYGLLTDWSKLTKSLNVYEYDPISWIGSLLCPTYMDHARALSMMFDKYNVKGGVVDRVPYTMERSPSIFINYYMERRIKTDPTRKPEKELSDMCKAFFGPAGRSMNLYYLELAKVSQFMHPGRERVLNGLYKYYEMFDKNMVQNARRYMNQALNLSAGTGVYEERVKLMNLSQQYLEAYLDGVWSAQANDYDKCVAAFDRVDQIIDQLDAKKAIEASDAHWRLHGARLKTLAEYFPDQLGYVRHWRLLGPFPNPKRDADFTTDSFEPVSDVYKPVTVDGKTYNWKEYINPQGMLTLEYAYTETEKSSILSYCYAGTTIVAPRTMQVQFRMDSFFAFRVYVNGKEVFHRPGVTADTPDRQIVQVKLEKGENTIVFKSSQTGITTDSYPWGIYFKVTDTSGEPIFYKSVEDGKLIVDDSRLVIPVAELPEEWKFTKDQDDKGGESGWYAADFDDSGWQMLPVAKYWDDNIGTYIGYGWYRTRFTLPAEVKDAQVTMRFEGVDEQAWVYLNGKLIGERTTQSTGKSPDQFWELPFDVPLQNAIYGGENVLAVRVHNMGYAGGIYKPVNILR